MVIRILFKILYNGVLGGVALLIVNFLGNSLGFHIAFNVVTALAVGFLGLPGLGLLVIIQSMFNS